MISRSASALRCLSLHGSATAEPFLGYHRADQPFSIGVSGGMDRCLLELADSSFVQPKYPVLSALLLEISLKLVPCAEVFATVGTCDRRFPDGMRRDTKADLVAIGTFEQVVQVSIGHDSLNTAPS